MQRDEHVRRDPHNRELEKPVQRHTHRIADIANPRGEDLGPVEVRNRAETDRPADGVDEDGGDSCVGGGFVV